MCSAVKQQEIEKIVSLSRNGKKSARCILSPLIMNAKHCFVLLSFIKETYGTVSVIKNQEEHQRRIGLCGYLQGFMVSVA